MYPFGKRHRYTSFIPLDDSTDFSNQQPTTYENFDDKPSRPQPYFFFVTSDKLVTRTNSKEERGEELIPQGNF